MFFCLITAANFDTYAFSVHIYTNTHPTNIQNNQTPCTTYPLKNPHNLFIPSSCGGMLLFVFIKGQRVNTEAQLNPVGEGERGSPNKFFSARNHSLPLPNQRKPSSCSGLVQ